MKALDLPFAEIWLHDFEFVSKPGERPDVVCLVARELRSGRTLQLWRDDLDKCGSTPPYRVDSSAVFVSFVANAECACHLALGWPLPRNVLDLSPVFRRLTNGLPAPEGKGLLGALRYFGLDAISTKDKEDARDRVIAGWPFTEAERKWILDYCRSDVDAMEPLLDRILRDMTDRYLSLALHHGEFAGVSALMEHRGVPIDGDVFRQLADPDVWREIRDALVPKVDAKYGVYIRGPDGWSFSTERFRAYLLREGIAWPESETGKLIMRQKVFESMCKAFPQLEDLRQLRHARDKMRRIKLAVGADDRNRTVLWPFQSKTSRTQPKASRWIFSPAVWLRCLIKPTPGMAIAYIDCSGMEFQIAAVLSDKHCGSNNRMLDAYNSGDPYLTFAKQVGAVPQTATKASHKAVREAYKIVGLGTLYGMQEDTLAARTRTTKFTAGEMLRQHREEFAGQYWRWSDDWLQHSLQTGIMRTAMGWTCRVGDLEKNERTIRNWPIQSTGGDMLRIACVWAERRGIRLLAPVHDAVLIEAPIDRIEADVKLMQDIWRRTSRIVFNPTADGPHQLRTDQNIVRYPDRYEDERGVKFWNEVLDLLAEVQRARRAA